ncbi:cell division cycle protein 27 homolog isoform X2 [Penaeus monodon]|uniref:cell division cycle protein 27 homolog isoform X2 n=1 Tax=Penaeus monodon TaxID=6687 RepID=UPI0018A706E9|nr:cell division cycle protein 27 homolog isoform X2 [Penaeus monodon]
MLVQEPVQAAIWHCLNHYAYVDATFLAERLLAEVDSDEALHLVATSYYRSGKPGRAYSVLHTHGTRTPQLRFLMARCCYDLGKLEEAETVLTGGSVLHPKTVDELANEYGDLACFALQLLGLICARTERLLRAADAFKRSLKLNPFLWQSFVALCDQGDKIDPSKVFRLDLLETFSNCHGNTVLTLVNSANPANNVSVNSDSGVTNNMLNSVSVNTPSDGVQQTHIPTPVQNTPNNLLPIINTPVQSLSNMSTPVPISSQNTPVAVMVTPVQDRGGGDTGDGVFQAPKKKKFVRIKSMLGGPWSVSPMTPSFGVLPLDVTSPVGDNEQSPLNSSVAFLTPSPLTLSQLDTEPNTKVPPPISKRILCRTTKDSPLVLNKPAVFAPAGNNSNFQSPPTGQPNPNVRRSSRLFGNSNSVKENNKSRFVAPKSPARKAKTRSSKSQSSLSELNEKNKSENQDIISPSDKPLLEKPTTPQNLAQQAHAIQKQSAEGLMALLRDMGAAYQQLAQYNCARAIELLTALPTQHYRTGWVLSHIGKAHFEMNNYQQAVKYFSEVREREPHRLDIMEYYSTALWHLQKEVQLSALAQDLIEEDRECPQAWCTTGNCFSLQKEHEAAIRFFSRAIQVDPNFAYAYTLLGHEHIATEELDKALSCYRSAVRIDPRHYNAWYGIGLVLFKQERFAQAESHFKKALGIHPHSSVLMCHVAVVEHALQKSSAALATLNRALAVEPRNPLCKYHRASILHATDHHQEALAELNQLKEIVPKESNVYFLLGKVHKKLGQTHLALMNFSWAMDLDPKGANNQFKEAIDPAINRFPVDDEDTTNNNPHDNGSEASSLAPAESSQESLILEPQQLPNMESLSDDSL